MFKYFRNQLGNIGVQVCFFPEFAGKKNIQICSSFNVFQVPLGRHLLDIQYV